MQQKDPYTKGVQGVTAHKTARHGAKNAAESGVAKRERSLLGGRDRNAACLGGDVQLVLFSSF